MQFDLFPNFCLVLHLGLQRRHLETQLATEHEETERLRQEMALLQGHVTNLTREKKDLYTLLSHKVRGGLEG